MKLGSSFVSPWDGRCSARERCSRPPGSPGSTAWRGSDEAPASSYRIARAAHANAAKVSCSLVDREACACGGASVGHAFELAAERDQGPLGDAMREAVRALAHGLPRDDAYQVLSAHVAVPEVRRVVSALRRAERLGTSIAVTAADLAREVRGD